MSGLCTGGPSKPLAPQTNALSTARAPVVVVHSGYTPPIPMLHFVAYDSGSGAHGVPYSVVFDACRILANNKDGTLRKLGSDTVLIASSPLSLLSPGTYTYIVSGDPVYPICTTFRSWDPPNSLPASWAGSAMGAAEPVLQRASQCSETVKWIDGRCALTGDTSRLECCYLVPPAERPWWLHHRMATRTNDYCGINGLSNCITLRADLTGAGIDQGAFVFAPYDNTAVCVCLTDALADFASHFHLRAVNLPPRTHPLNTYARFAWGIFKAFQRQLLDFKECSDSPAVVPEPHCLQSSKRKRAQDDDEREQGDADASEPRVPDDDSQAPSDDLDLWHVTERTLQGIESMDATLHTRPLTSYEINAGMYPGYSRPMRMAYEYRQTHPEVSAVRTARIGRLGEWDDVDGTDDFDSP
ncbi:hypothetical protein B0H15DRAFT_831646 [Mycena belliarum]|uniref:HNH nuclease domain-containing protein n=1 Tax=Mycena belliarum TaxID=1033014 RepID=A0AAD6U937_9AGAR|nr:hypothetical protein B0H15DRAFT_831646 [Mycena belliae]